MACARLAILLLLGSWAWGQTRPYNPETDFCQSGYQAGPCNSWIADYKQVPIDVPAIHVAAKSEPATEANCNTESGVCFDGGWVCSNHGTAKWARNELRPKCSKGWRWGCADKTRILMNDEQDQPKRWCHAPQTN
jgi:hypothetical protein